MWQWRRIRPHTRTFKHFLFPVAVSNNSRQQLSSCVLHNNNNINLRSGTFNIVEALWADWALVCQPPTQLHHELLRPATPCLLKDYRINVPSGFKYETKCLYEKLGERETSHICYGPWQQWDETGGCHNRSWHQTRGTHFACLKIPLHHIYISEPFSSFVFPCANARQSLHWISFHVRHKDIYLAEVEDGINVFTLGLWVTF